MVVDCFTCCLGWTVDNPQEVRTALDREGTAAVFIFSTVVMGKVSGVVVDRVEGCCLLLVVDCRGVVVGFWIKMDRAFNVLQLR